MSEIKLFNTRSGAATEIGDHWGTGDLEVWVHDAVSLEKARPLIVKSYDG